MFCQNCNTHNESRSTFCINCGVVLNKAPLKQDQSLNFLLIILSWEYFTWIFWFFIQNIYVPKYFNSDSELTMTLADFYILLNWTSDIISLILLIVFFILSKVSSVKAFLFVFLLIKIALLIGYRMLN